MARRELAIEVKVSKVQEIAKLTASLKELRKEQRELTAQLAKKEKVSKAEAASFDTRFRQIKKESDALRQRKKELQDNIAATTKATKSSNGMAKQFIKGAAAIGIVVTAFRRLNNLVSGMVTTFTQFEFTMAKVNAVSGATEQEFQALTKSAEDLGRSTFFTAEQVAQLQLNFSKLGFTSGEILAAQEATLNLATATGSDLARAATVAGASVRGFGLSANETSRVVDVMAVSFSSSALDIEKWSTGMTKVAPIAKSAGFSIEDTAAIFAQLSNAGIEASIAGTSLRNIFLAMQDPNSDLVKSFGRTIHSLDELVPALNKFSEEGGDLAAIMQVVEKRQAAAFEQMITSRERTLELRDALNLANGEAQRMADIIGDTLQGRFLRFKSATEGLSISLLRNFTESLQSALEKATDFVGVLTENTKTIVNLIKLLGTAIKTFAAYRIGMVAITAVTRRFTKATLTTTAAVQGFARALATTGVGLAVIALGQLAAKYLLVADAADKAADAERKRQENIASDIEFIDNLLNVALANTASQSEENIKVFGGFLDALKNQKEQYLNQLDRLKNAEGEYYSNLSYEETKKKVQAEEQLKVLNKQIPLLEEKIELEVNNLKELNKSSGLQTKESKDLIALKEEEIRVEKEKQATDLASLAIKNQNLARLQEELKELREYGLLKKEERDVEREIFEFKVQRMNLGLTTEIENAEIRKQLVQQEIDMIKMLLTQQLAYGVSRESLIERLIQLEKELTDAKTTENKTRLEDDIVTASLSGQNALQAVKSVIRAHVMKAVAGHIEKIITNPLIPFPLNLALAAGAGIAVSTLVDNALAKIAPAESAGILGGGGSSAANVSAGTRTTYARGGMVHGRSHAEGGEKFAVGGRVVELEGGEAVINKRSTAMFRNQLSAMNSAGGGVKFADGGLLNMPSFTTAQFDALNSQTNIGQQKVVVVEADITDAQNTVSTIQSEATI
tara:strand:- start:3389 stop:6280 length:2892 start_codon:yes stop_codon:yes gene_type:complete